jgi:hypothetical protein
MLPSTFYMQFSPHKNHSKVVDYQPSIHCLLCVVEHGLSSVCQYDCTYNIRRLHTMQSTKVKTKQQNKNINVMESKPTNQQSPLEQNKKENKAWNLVTKHMQHNIKEK